MTQPLTVRDLHKNTKELSKQAGWNTRPLERLKYLAGEVIELTTAAADDVGTTDDDIADEVFDVVWNAIDMARLMGVSAARMEAAFRRKMAFNAKRFTKAKQ